MTPFLTGCMYTCWVSMCFQVAWLILQPWDVYCVHQYFCMHLHTRVVRFCPLNTDSGKYGKIPCTPITTIRLQSQCSTDWAVDPPHVYSLDQGYLEMVKVSAVKNLVMCEASCDVSTYLQMSTNPQMLTNPQTLTNFQPAKWISKKCVWLTVMIQRGKRLFFYYLSVILLYSKQVLKWIEL